MSNAVKSALQHSEIKVGRDLGSHVHILRQSSGTTHDTSPNLFVTANGCRYAYRRFGRQGGTPIVLLQHFRGTMDDWDPAVTDGLARTRDVILFDNAGVGLSGGRTPFTVGAMAAHATAFIEALGLAKVDLLGFSLGGFIAQAMLLDRPDLVRRAVLAGTGPRGGPGIKSFMPEVAAAATETPIRPETLLFLFFQPSATSQSAGRAFLRRTQSRTADRDTMSTAETMQAQITAIAAWGEAPAKGYAALHAIKQPVLIVNGINDIMVPTVNSFFMAQHLPNAQLILYPDAGHGSQFQYPELFVAHVNRFLAD